MALIDQMWVLICALFVFFMQAGFICYEVGFIQPKNVIAVAIENIIAFVIATLSFFAIGYAFMFGPSWHGLVGMDYFLGSHITESKDYVILFFELMFAGTAVTIFSGSLSERTKTKSLIIAAIIVGSFIYPIYGHWVWGGETLQQAGWLKAMGFMDFAGATVVHGTAGWIALAGIFIVGPRKNRWDDQGTIQQIGRSNIPFAALGTFILWFSWFGFNGGSQFAFNNRIGSILMNTNLSASAGVIGAVLTVILIFRKKSAMEAILSGALGGLVAITACSNMVNTYQAFVIGFVAGAVVVFSSKLLEHLKIDDAVGAVSIHAFAGITGSLFAAIFAAPEYLPHSNRIIQLGIQMIGVSTNAIWSFGLGLVMFKVIDVIWGLRVTAVEEEKGLNIVEFADVYTWEQSIKEKTYANITEDLVAQVRQKNIALEKQSQLLIATQDQEREQIGRDLHDGVGQILAATKLDLGILRRNLKDEGHINHVNRLIKFLDQTVEEIRAIIYNLKPIQLEQKGLLKSIEATTDHIHKVAGIEFYDHIASPLPTLGESETLNIYRVIQESLNNIMKHANATRVDFVFTHAGPNLFWIIIKDNGQGFDTEQAFQGIGMSSMKERMQLIGGTIKLESIVGKGTTITLEIPYEAN